MKRVLATLTVIFLLLGICYGYDWKENEKEAFHNQLQKDANTWTKEEAWQDAYSQAYTSSSSAIWPSRNILCAATPCPNKATNGQYCDIHIKGKTNKCAICKKEIWGDETFCDDCLFG